MKTVNKKIQINVSKNCSNAVFDNAIIKENQIATEKQKSKTTSKIDETVSEENIVTNKRKGKKAVKCEEVKNSEIKILENKQDKNIVKKKATNICEDKAKSKKSVKTKGKWEDFTSNTTTHNENEVNKMLSANKEMIKDKNANSNAKRKTTTINNKENKLTKLKTKVEKSVNKANVGKSKDKKSAQVQKCLSRLIEIRKELDRRKNLPIVKYNNEKPLHLKQIAFHKCEKRNRWVFGGNRSGKTECGAVEAIWWCRGIHPYRKNKDNVEGWAVSLSYEVQRDVAQAKIMKYLPKNWIADISMMSGRKGSAEYGIIDYILIKNIFGGVSKLSFKSCDQGREKFQGASLDFVWFDEEPPYDIYEECRMRVIDRTGDIWGTMTPLKGLTWVYDIIYLNSGDDDEIWCETMEWADNPYLSKKEINSLSKTMSKDTLESRRYGHFNSSEGLVYTEFEISKHVIEPFDIPLKWQDCISIDPGLHNPLACLFFAIDYDSNVYVVDEYYKSGKDIDYHASKIFAKAKELNWKYDSKGRIYGLIDSAANQKTLSSIKSVTELFYDKGIIVNPCVEKTLFAGIATVKDYLASSKLFIFKNCVNLIREIKSYWWGKGDNPIKKDDHALDALRYYLMSKPQPSQIEKFIESDITKDKRRLMRKRGRYDRK